MTRGNQRDKDRARAEARKAKTSGKGESTGYKVGGANTHANALAEKIAKKKAAQEAGEFQEKKGDGGSKKPPGTKIPPSMINPHTGKKDASYTEKMLKKAAS